MDESAVDNSEFTRRGHPKRLGSGRPVEAQCFWGILLTGLLCRDVGQRRGHKTEGFLTTDLSAVKAIEGRLGKKPSFE
jgi:hypothetical protein